MERLKPPGPLSFEGNVAQTWKTWRKAFDFYLVATESDAKSDKIKTSILLTCIGECGREIYEIFEFATEGNALKLKPFLDQFEAYCNPRSNTTINRHKFFTHRQIEVQTFNHFVTELRTLSAECEFENLRDSLIKDMIICGVSDRAPRERMLREPKIDLKKAIELGLAAEQTKQHAKQLTTQIDCSINKVRHSRRKGRKQSVAGAAPCETEGKQFKGKQSQMIKRCKFCAGSHARGHCPAYELRTLSAECEFENLRDSLIKDMIICGVSDRALRERMLREPKIDLKKAIELGLAAEQTKQHAKQLTTQIDCSVNKVSHSRRKGRKQSVAGAAPCETEGKQFK
eukprot:gene21043-23098_t